MRLESLHQFSISLTLRLNPAKPTGTKIRRDKKKFNLEKMGRNHQQQNMKFNYLYTSVRTGIRFSEQNNFIKCWYRRKGRERETRKFLVKDFPWARIHTAEARSGLLLYLLSLPWRETFLSIYRSQRTPSAAHKFVVCTCLLYIEPTNVEITLKMLRKLFEAYITSEWIIAIAV